MDLLRLLKVLKNFNGDLYKINVDNYSARVDIKLDWTEKGNANWGTEYLRFENNTIEWTNDSDFKVEMVFQNNNNYYISKGETKLLYIKSDIS